MHPEILGYIVRAHMSDIQREIDTKPGPTAAPDVPFDSAEADKIITQLKTDQLRSELEASQFDQYDPFTGIGIRRLYGQARHAEITLDSAIMESGTSKRFVIYDLSPKEVKSFEDSLQVLSTIVSNHLYPSMVTNSLSSEVLKEDLSASVLVEVDNGDEIEYNENAQPKPIKLVGIKVRSTNNGRTRGTSIISIPKGFDSTPLSPTSVGGVIEKAEEMLGWAPSQTEINSMSEQDYQSLEAERTNSLFSYDFYSSESNNPSKSIKSLMEDEDLFHSICQFYGYTFATHRNWRQKDFENPKYTESYIRSILLPNEEHDRNVHLSILRATAGEIVGLLISSTFKSDHSNEALLRSIETLNDEPNGHTGPKLSEENQKIIMRRGKEFLGKGPGFYTEQLAINRQAIRDVIADSYHGKKYSDLHGDEKKHISEQSTNPWLLVFHKHFSDVIRQSHSTNASNFIFWTKAKGSLSEIASNRKLFEEVITIGDYVFYIGKSGPIIKASESIKAFKEAYMTIGGVLGHIQRQLTRKVGETLGRLTIRRQSV